MSLRNGNVVFAPGSLRHFHSMPTRGFVVLALGAALAGVAGAAAPPAVQSGGASARAYAVRIVLPDQAQPIVQGESVTPPDGAGFLQMFQYPSDGSAVQTGALTYSVSSSPGPTATAQAAAGITTLSLFRGEITADTVSGRARATASQTASSGDVAGSGFVNLSVLGQIVP